MKPIKFLLVSFMVTLTLAACENHMDIKDTEAGTPTKSDSVLPAKHQPLTPEQIQAYNEKLPRVYLR